jgi:hypothetical protein
MIEQKSLFDNDDDLNRIDIEWLIYNAIREGTALSLGSIESVGHQDTLRFAQRLAPNLFASSDSHLFRELESTESREVRDIARATNVSFEVALNTEINRYENLVNSNKNEPLESLNKRLSRLRKLQSETKSQEYYEGKLIERDARLGGNLPKLPNNSDGYFDFTLPAGKVMRIRVTHETKIEEINGADLIYEHHDPEKDRVHITAVQYKILINNKYIQKSQRLKRQLIRLDKCFCQELPCKDNNEEKNKFSFRFPTCTAFLRPTYRLQSSNSRIMSRGFYLPICLVNSLWENNQEISEQIVGGQVIRQAVFDELFNANLIGSKWIDTKRLDEIYKNQGILRSSETAVVHVRIHS